MQTIPITAQVGLTYTKGFWGWAIRHITRSHFNHVVIAISETECIGAEPGGARIRPNSDYPDVVWSQFDYTESQRDTIVAFVSSQEDAAYSYFDDFLIGVAILARTHAPWWIQRRLANLHRWQCAALGDAALYRAKIFVFDDGRPFGAVYPGSFTKFWRRHGWLAAATLARFSQLNHG